MTKNDLRQAKHHSGNEEAVHELSVKFHKHHSGNEEAAHELSVKFHKHHPGNEEAAHELSVKFHQLLRLHNKAKKTSLKARMNSETFKLRKECQQSFWKFESKIFNEEDSSTIPCFNQQSSRILLL